MDIKTAKHIIEASGRFISENGPGEFTFEKLSMQPEKDDFDPFTLVKNEEQIFEQLLHHLENELKTLVNEVSYGTHSPALEFEMLFKQLHRLFKQKTYYLTVIFDRNMHRRYSDAEKIISRIKGVAISYLINMKRISINLTIFFLLILSSLAFAQPVTVGIVTDAPGYEFDLLTRQVKAETKALIHAGNGAVFKELTANWQPEKVKENLLTFLTDPEVDMVVTLGFFSSDAAARLPDYPKPVIAATVLDQELQKLSVKTNVSHDNINFSWTESLISLKSDMQSFARIFEFSHLAVILPGKLYSEFSVLTTYLNDHENVFDVSFVPVDKNENPLEQLPSGVEAAMVFPLVQHSANATEEIFDGLNQQGIPSLAVNGTAYLELGATITFTPQFTFQQIARQVAVRILKACEGNSMAGVPSVITGTERAPIINMESLRLTDIFPRWPALENAVLLNVAKIPGEELTLHGAIALAMENNLQGKIINQDLLMAEKDIRIAKANILPRVEAAGTAVQLSENLVESSMGQRGEFTVAGTVSLKQVIYSEAAYANIALKKLMAENMRHSNRQTTLDIVFDVSEAYISLLFAKNNLQIKNENIKATLQNLKLAKDKEKTGEGSVSDVNRWTSELNLGRMDLNDAEAKYRAAMYRLNEMLNLPVGNTFATPDSANIAETVIYNQNLLNFYFSNPKSTEKYADFIIDEMLTQSPELRQLATAGEMIDRQRSMNIRQMYLPQVALTGSADQAFVREGVIRNPQLPVPPPPDDITWNLGLRVSVPLFEGGRKRNEVQRATIEQDKITWQKEDLVNKLETGIRSNVQFLQASYREIELAENAARAAEDNFNTIQDAYAQGMANVAQLTDAQSVMIRTRQMALASRYQYMLDYIKIERLQGRFIFLENESERMQYADRLLNYLTEK
jgi:outer membrane protein TolC